MWMSKIISLKSIAAVLVSAIGTWIGIESLFSSPRWPWIGLVLGTLVIAVPLHGLIARIVHDRSAPEESVVDLRDVVTFWIVAAIMMAGWLAINAKPF